VPFENYTVPLLIGRILGLLLGFTIHEWAHAWSAYKLGDDTARWQGRLRLDPRAHIDPIGLFLALIAGFGWARPVPVNPSRFYPRERQGLMLTAFAGPLTNLLIAFFFALLMRSFILMDWVAVDGFRVSVENSFMRFVYEILFTIIFFNLGLFLFNLIPLSPLDGWKIMMGLLPSNTAYKLSLYERESTFALMMLFMLGVISPAFNIVWVILSPPLRFLFEILTGIPV
jgi:Zn-dependent protease